MPTWKLAGVQMDCTLGDIAGNRANVRRHLAAAVGNGAKVVVFPECSLAGYGFGSRAEIAAHAEPFAGPSAAILADDCARLGVWCVYGFFETAGDKLFNSAALIGPNGPIACYRKLHLPCVGADRFTDPGDRPMAVHDLGGLKIGLHICFDGGFPETTRVLTLLGADLAILPTNWADKAMKSATLTPPVRALENKIYFAAVNRIGVESGFHYIGHSSITDPFGESIDKAFHDREAILYADIDPAAARDKLVVNIPGDYEIDRVNWRRPDMYGPLLEGRVFTGHRNG